MADLIAIRLLLWAIPWMLATIIGFKQTSNEFWRAFWLMSGAWAVVNGVIAIAGLLGNDPSPQNLRQILWVNVGLDVIYILVAIWLYQQNQPQKKGFGLAVGIQGLFLLLFDLFHAIQI